MNRFHFPSPPRPAPWLLTWISLLLALPQSALASGGFDPAAHLETIETEHFRIVYDAAEGREAALEIARIAEEVRARVLDTLGVPGPPRYDILLFDNHDYANGSSSGYPGNTMRFYLTAPAPPAGGSSDISDMVGDTWFRILFTHEFAHAVHLGRFTGWTKIWRWLTHGHPFHLIYPGWFIEGYAVALETSLTPGGRAASSTTRMFLRTDVLAGRLLQIGAWGNVQGWPGPGSRYLYGGAFLGYVADRFGDESLQRIIDATNAQVPYLDDIRLDAVADLVSDLGGNGERFRPLRAGGLERGFQRAVGLPLSTVLHDWTMALTRASLQIQETVAASGESRVVRLSFDGGRTESPAFLPGGASLVYTAGPDSGLNGIKVVGTEGGNARLLVARSGIDGRIAVFPDRNRIVYSRFYRRDQPGARSTYRMDLFAFDLDTGRETRLTHGLRAADPAISPDGTWIFAVVRERGLTRLVRMDADGSNVTNVLIPDRRFQLSTPAVSPDGRRIAFSLLIQQDPPATARYTIGLANVNGDRFEILDGPGVNREPTWIDADHLLFSSDRTGIYNLYAIDLRSGQVRAVTNVTTGAFQPRVYPGEDGPVVVFRGYSSAGFDIYRLEPTRPERAALAGEGPGRPVPDVRSIWVTCSASAGSPANTATPPAPSPVGVADATEALDQEPRVPAPGSGAGSGRMYPPEGVNPIVPLREASIQPAAPLPKLEARPYHPVTGLRLLRLAPATGNDEGAWSSGFQGGPTLGIEARVGEPTGRHAFYGMVDMGLYSRQPNYYTSYTNRSFGFPMTVYAREGADAVGTVQEQDMRFLVWQRGPEVGSVVSFPWSRGMSSAAISLGAGAGRFLQFYALSPVGPDGTPDGLTGRAAGLVQTFDFGWGQGNAWRNPSQGHFFSIGASQSMVWYDDRHGMPGWPEPRWQVWAEYTGRKWLGRGVLDLDLKAGHRVGWEYRYLLGGFSGTWAIPGVALASAVDAPTVALAGVTLSQDVWRPEFPVGAVPWLFLSRVRVELAATTGAGWMGPTRRVEVAPGLAAGVKAFLFTLRNGMNFVPRAYAGIDLRTMTPTWWVSLGITPDVYSSLFPASGRSSLEVD